LDTVDGFDATFFGISPREATSLDPQHRLLLEVAWESLEHAGQAPDRLMGSRTGVFIGMMTQDYQHRMFSVEQGRLDAYSTTGNGMAFAAGRLSYVLGFQGPCLSIDTACSSSLVAVHLACQSLRSGESELALAGGVSLLLSSLTMHLVAQTQALSPDGRCRAFDARANGFVRSEGCGIVVLKRLSDARRDGDRIWALIRGSAVNQDGRSTGLTAPNVLSQQALLRQALKNARVSSSQIGYIEAHGTGTSLGDPIEVEALKEVLGEPRADGTVCALGSVKTNMGHLEAAAGVAGLMKVVLSLHYEMIPRHLHFQTLNPRISLDRTPFVIPTRELPWTAGKSPRVAGVSSFGLSGTNAHVILEEAPREPENAAAQAQGEPLAEIVPLSAKSREALRTLARAYQDHLTSEADEAGASLKNIAYTASVRRSHHTHRLSMVAGSRAELSQGLEAFLREASHPGLSVGGGLAVEVRPKVVFIFPGQGSQWDGMGRELLEHEPVFRQAIEDCDAAFRAFTEWSLVNELRAEESASLLDRIDVVQPTLFAMSVGLAALWRAWGMEPDAVVGHSMGEVAAAHVAGALGLEDAARIICRRSQLLRRMSGKGAMAVVELPWGEAAEHLVGYEERVSVAVSNSPRSTVLSGDPAALDELLARFQEQQIFCRRVKVDVASHSPQMDELRDDLLAALSNLAPRAGKVPIYSTVNSDVCDGASFDALYWARNLREPVQFARALEQLIKAEHTLFVEVSPHPVLLPLIEPMLQESGRAQESAIISSLRRQRPERAMMLESLGELYTRGYPVDWSRLHPAGGQCVSLPTYAWQRERYWIEVDTAKERSNRPAHASASAGGGHPLLGTAFSVSMQPEARLWEMTLSSREPAYLSDHQVQEAVLLPAAAYVEMALSAAREAFGSGPHAIEEMIFHEALVLSEEGRTVQMVLTEEGSRYAVFRLSSLEEPRAGPKAKRWSLHASGTLRLEESEGAAAGARVESLEAIQARCGMEVGQTAYYAALAERGLVYGPAFQAVQQVFRGAGEALGRLRLAEGIAGQTGAYELHPTLLDAGLQVLAAAMTEGESESGPAVPVGLRRLRVHRRPGVEAWSHARVRRLGEGADAPLEGDVVLLDGSGEVLVEALGLRVQRLEQVSPKPRAEELLLGLDWQPAETLGGPAVGSTSSTGRWLLLADKSGVGDALQSLLEARGEVVVRVEVGAITGRAGAERYEVNPASPEAFDMVLREAFQEGASCRAIIYLWGLDIESAETAAVVLDGPVRACGSALHLVQALVRKGWRDPPRLWLITRGAQAIGREAAAVAVTQAPLWGLGRTAGFEHPELRCTQVDLAPASFADEALTLVRELLSDHREEEVALRPEGRYVARLTRSVASAGPEEMLAVDAAERRLLRPDGTYLITGGLGGLGLSLAGWMVSEGARHLVLVGRQGAITPAQMVAVAALESAGTDVVTARVDVADSAQLAEALEGIRARMPPLRGVVHAAGVLDDALLAQQDLERFRRVMAPKVTGGWNLHVLTQDTPLDFIVI
jgi:myxalamid-type polyketide synthase MxaE and MxaD